MEFITEYFGDLFLVDIVLYELLRSQKKNNNFVALIFNFLEK